MTANQPENICLIGLMGSGKSSVAPLLAELLDMEHVDLDKEIALRQGRTIMMVFADQGEETFRQEEQVLLQHHCGRDGMIIDCGGGVVLAAGNRHCLQRNFTVYLKAGLETLADRVGTGAGRPLLQGDGPVKDRLAALLAEREPLYRECSAIAVPTDDRTPAEIAAEIVSHLPASLKPAAQ